MGDMYDDDQRNGADDLEDTGREAVDTVKNAKNTADKIKDLSSANKGGKGGGEGGSKDGGSGDSPQQSPSSDGGSDYGKKTPSEVGGDKPSGGGSAAKAGSTGGSTGGSAASTAGGSAASTGGAAATTAGTTGAAAGGTAAAGGAAAAGVAATGVGAIVVAAAVAAKKIAETASSDVSSDSEGGKNLLMIIAVAVVAIISAVLVVLAPAIVIIYLLTQMAKPISGIMEEGLIGYAAHTIESHMEEKEKEKFFKKLLGDDWHESAELTREWSAETVEVCKDIVDYSIQRAYDKYVWEILFDLGSYKEMLFDGYNPYETYKKFKQARHPYSTKKVRGPDGTEHFITIQEYIDNYDKPGYENDDLNYAELFTVICQKENFSYSSFNYSDFYDIMVNKRTTELLFELQVENEEFYKYTKGGKDELKRKKAEGTGSKDASDAVAGEHLTAEQVNEEFKKGGVSTEDSEEEEDPNPINTLYSWADSIKRKIMEVTDKVVRFFERWAKNFFFAYNVTVKPYGLEELYMIADIRPDVPSSVNETMRNIDMLDVQEALLRGVLIDSDLGPAYDEPRSGLSSVFNDLKEMMAVSREGIEYSIYGDPMVNYPTGRSAMCYVEHSLVSIASGDIKIDQFWMSFPDLPEEEYMEWATETQDLEGTTVVLNIPKYVYQLHHDLSSIPRGNHGTFGDYGCIDSCFYMISNYYNLGLTLGGPTDANTMVEYVKENSKCAVIADDGEYYVPVGAGYIGKDPTSENWDQFLWYLYCQDSSNDDQIYDFIPHEFNVAGAGDRYQAPFYPNLVKSYIAQGTPVILHIKGKWVYNGNEYHKSDFNHYILIMGYDDKGFYVMDPGNQSISDVYDHSESHVIPYEAFECANEKWIRAIESFTRLEYSGVYLINTIAERSGEE